MIGLRRAPVWLVAALVALSGCADPGRLHNAPPPSTASQVPADCPAPPLTSATLSLPEPAPDFLHTTTIQSGTLTMLQLGQALVAQSAIPVYVPRTLPPPSPGDRYYVKGIATACGYHISLWSIAPDLPHVNIDTVPITGLISGGVGVLPPGNRSSEGGTPPGSTCTHLSVRGVSIRPCGIPNMMRLFYQTDGRSALFDDVSTPAVAQDFAAWWSARAALPAGAYLDVMYNGGSAGTVLYLAWRAAGQWYTVQMYTRGMTASAPDAIASLASMTAVRPSG